MCHGGSRRRASNGAAVAASSPSLLLHAPTGSAAAADGVEMTGVMAEAAEKDAGHAHVAAAARGVKEFGLTLSAQGLKGGVGASNI